MDYAAANLKVMGKHFFRIAAGSGDFSTAKLEL